MGVAAMQAIATSFDAAQLLSAMLLCALSLILGLLLPRPKWLRHGLNARTLLLTTPFGRWLRAVVLAAHGVLIVKAVWREFFAVGTARAVIHALWLSLTTGQAFTWPGSAQQQQHSSADAAAAAALSSAAAAAPADDWLVTDADLERFRWTIEQEGRPEGASEWEAMMDKDWPGATYAAWRRDLASGKTEYKSITVAEDATAQEFMDFYLDDDTRPKWDAMVSEHQLLAAGDPASRQQVVRWVRTFPLSFVSQREYVIARRTWRGEDGTLYAVTKGVMHPAAPLDGRMVRMETYYSCWRSRTVPCPRGSGRPACETLLLHFEDLQMPERLARFAVRHGMAGFVKSMVPWMVRFVQERRLRCPPHEEDPAGYGVRAPLRAPLPIADVSPFTRIGLLDSSLSTGSSASGLASPADSTFGTEDGVSEREGATRVKRSASMRRLGLAMVASGVAYAIARSASGSAIGSGTGSSTGPAGSPQQEAAARPAAAAGDRPASRGGRHKRRQQQQHGSGGKHRHQQRGSRLPRTPAPVSSEA